MSRRMERVDQLIRDELSQLIPVQMTEWGLDAMVSVTEVKTAPDLSLARVFISVLGTPEEKSAVLTKLGGAAGYFRRILASRLFIRKVPEISFRSDESIERGSRLLELLDQVAAEEEKEPPQRKRG